MAEDLVFEIVREWQREDLKQRKRRHTNLFLEYFQENCSHSDILHLREETTLDGTFEIFKYISEHIMKPFGYDECFFRCARRCSRPWRRYSLEVESLLLAE